MRWMKGLTRLICKLRGHDFPCPTFNAYTLCFCQHCGKEIADRTFNDLEPLSPEEQDMLLAEEM